MKKYFFDIPVYRLSCEKYQDEQNKFLTNYYFNVCLKKGTVKSLVSYNDFRDNHNRYFMDSWRYNEIIGYIRLYISGRDIKGEYYQHNVQKIYKTRKKNFKFQTLKLAAEKSLAKKTNEEIYNTILEYLQSCSLELKRRYIDIENFRQIGKFVDWNAFIKQKII